jgi:hypothetical protein
MSSLAVAAAGGRRCTPDLFQTGQARMERRLSAARKSRQHDPVGVDARRNFPSAIVGLSI